MPYSVQAEQSSTPKTATPATTCRLSGVGAVARSGRLSVLALAVAAMTSTPAMADETSVIQLDKMSVTAEGESTKANSDTEYVAEDTRTATGLPLDAKDTPQSVSVFTQQRMKDQNLTTLNDVLSQTAGVSVKEYDSARQYYFARGFEINTIMIDGAPTLFDPGWGTGENAANTHLYEQVDIIKGATGLTTGSGNPSAAINLIRKRAGDTELTGEVSAEAASRDGRAISADVAGALNTEGTLRGRAVVAHNRQDSFRNVGDTEQNILYLTGEADVTDSTLVTLGASIQENVNNAPTWGGIPAWYSDGSRTNYNRSKTTAADWTYWNTTHKNIFAEVRQALNEDWDLNVHYSVGTNSGRSALLYVTGSPDRNTGAGVNAYPGSKFSTETRFSLADVFLSGSYQLFGREQVASAGFSQGVREFTADSAFASSVAPIGNFNQYDGTGYPEHVWDDSFLYEEFTDTQSALYGSTRIQLTDRLWTVLGARFTNQETDRKAAAYNDAGKIKNDGVFLPYAGVLYDLSEVYTAYASYTEIFSAQQERNVNGDFLDPIIGKSYEVGVKAGFKNDSLIASAAVFKTIQDNLATSDTGNTVEGTTDQAYKEAEGATSKGYELELVGAITERWEAQFGWTHYQVEDADGEQVNTTQPRRILKTFTRYQLPGDLSRFTIGGGVNWESRSYGDAINPATGEAEEVEQEALTLVSLMANYQVTPEFSTQFNVKNLTDETYYTNIGTFGQIAYGTPRTVSLSATYNF